jgi:NADH-quinone oxidoreductase subunit M
MVSHGLISGALFLCAGVVYDRMHTYEIDKYGGLVRRMPLYALAFMVFTLANIGLPGTTGFIGEFLTLIGTFQINNWVAFLATFGTILSACYMLYLYRRIIFGIIERPGLMGIADLTRREVVTLLPLGLLIIFYGVHPQPIIDASSASIEQIINGFSHAVTMTKSAGL